MKRKSGDEGGVEVGEEEEMRNEGRGGVAGALSVIIEVVVVVVTVAVEDDSVETAETEDGADEDEGAEDDGVELTATVEEDASAGKETVMEVRMEPFPVLVELVEIVTGPAQNNQRKSMIQQGRKSQKNKQPKQVQ